MRINIVDKGNNKTRKPIKVRKPSSPKKIINYIQRLENVKEMEHKILIFLILLSIFFSIITLYSNSVEAKDLPKYTSAICDSDKCRARVARLNECDNEKASDITHCAINKTLQALEISLMSELSSLEKQALRNDLNSSLSTTWKEKAIELAIKHESFSPSAYCDTLKPFIKGDGTRWLRKACYTWKERYSIGYGTISYKGAPNITEEEARKRMYDEMESNFFPLLSGVSCWNDNEKAAIADFAYNSGKHRKHARTGKPFSHYVSSCNKQEVLGFMDYWLYSWGVVKRKKAERNLFLLDNNNK